VRPIGPGETLRISLTARFFDTAGNTSPDWSESIEVTDGRRPEAMKTALGIVWTSRPGPAPEVELKLTWQARRPGERYRAYLADATSLNITGASRAEIARTAGERQRAGTLTGQAVRGRFRLLTESPLAEVGGRVTLDGQLPRSLQTVQLVRIVPLTDAGVEADFDSCGIVPVAVPTDRAPPPPRLTAHVPPGAMTAALIVEAVGLDLVQLHADEPGLFTEPPTAGVPPEFRLRRSSGTLSDPIYAREVRRGALSRTGDGDTISFQAKVDDPEGGQLMPFVRYTYWAEVRMPPERRLAGAPEAAPVGGITGVEPAQMMDSPRRFSRLSAPASVMVFPAEPPALADGAVTVQIVETAGLVFIRLAVTATPSVHPAAIGGYQLRIWEQWGDENITAVPDAIELAGAPLEWTSSPPRPAAGAPERATLRLSLIDPLGRVGPILTKSSA
jgi:hypothetical protein